MWHVVLAPSRDFRVKKTIGKEKGLHEVIVFKSVSTSTVLWLMVFWLMPHAVASGCRSVYDMIFTNIFWYVAYA
jgi:hypothetical protein